MRSNFLIILFVLSMVFVIFPSGFAEPDVSIILEKTTYTYCEKLFYTIKVSEVTGDLAIIHIRDEVGKGSSAIPIQILNLENPVPSIVPFEPEIFPLGTYYIDVEYSGVKYTTEFELIDLEKVCIPSWIKQVTYYWVTEQISDLAFIDGIEFLIKNEIIVIPEIETNVETQKEVPSWVKINAIWWLEEKITDEDFAKALQYLIRVGIIVI